MTKNCPEAAPRHQHHHQRANLPKHQRKISGRFTRDRRDSPLPAPALGPSRPQAKTGYSGDRPSLSGAAFSNSVAAPQTGSHSP
ncbi:MAG: hypothetical protein HC886_21290 [Leptolyngbyaceae cyanobacterium SM1_1_3]|nr:hypothetical protein [Leptolyngbyaceae cyanobacterium SM1_1_3]